MRNLFIVNTPFHLLTAYIISRFMKKGDKNYLALIHPHSYEKWKDSPILSYLSSTDAGYEAVYPLINFLSSRHKEEGFRKQVKHVEETLGKVGIQQVYLGSDIDPQNQFLVATLGLTSFYRFEDGLYSYYNENRRRNWWKEKFHKVQMEMIMKRSGIPLDIALNTSTASDSKAALGDYMYKPELLKRFSPGAFALKKSSIQKAMAELKRLGLYQCCLTKPSVLYLSQPLVEKKWITLEEELRFLKIFRDNFSGGQLVYKAHPNDSEAKLAYMKEHLPDLQIWPNPIPAEIILALEPKLKAVISYESTTLMYADLFAEGKVLSLSLSDCTGHSMYEKYKDIMEEAGVKFPGSMDELKLQWESYKQKNQLD